MYKRILHISLLFFPFFSLISSDDKEISAHKLFALARYAEAIPRYKQIIKTTKDEQERQIAQVNLAQCYIGHGLDTSNADLWKEAWNLFEQRIPLEISQGKRKQLENPLKPGQKFDGLTVKSVARYGFGDTLTFARLLALAKERGAKKTILHLPGIQRLLKGLLSRTPGIDHIITDKDTEIQPFDHDVYLMSLPGMISTDGYEPTTPSTIYHSDKPYIFADPNVVKTWQEKMDPHKVNVAICWRASKNPVAGGTRIIDRDIPLRKIVEALGSIERVQLYSVQGPPHRPVTETEFKNLEHLGQTGKLGIEDVYPDSMKGKIIHVTDEHGPFEDTAAVMHLCKRFAGCDTVFPNMYAAMADDDQCALFLLKKNNCDMRWGTKGEKTPWFKRARLLRQEKEGDWTPVLAAAKQDIQEVVKENK